MDKFVMYDDVAFIKQGWINRNKILVQGREHIFTVPLKNASSFITIAHTGINQSLYPNWCDKFMKTLAQAYLRAHYYKPASALVEAVLCGPFDTIAQLASASISAVCRYAGISTSIIPTATTYGNNELKAEDRVIDICRREHADVYINAAGGRELYSHDHFRESGIELRFIKPSATPYPQGGNTFVPWLSVIDLLMHNSPDEIKTLFDQYSIEE